MLQRGRDADGQCAEFQEIEVIPATRSGLNISLRQSKPQINNHPFDPLQEKVQRVFNRFEVTKSQTSGPEDK